MAIQYVMPNDSRARFATAMLWCMLTLHVIQLFLFYNLLGNFREILDGSGSRTALMSQGRLILFSSVIQMIFFVLCAFAFIQWFRRAYNNLAKKIGPLQHDEAWTLGAWFIPILNWFRPVEMMTELFSKTDALFSERIPGYQPKLHRGIIVLWWTVWVIATLLTVVLLNFNNDYVSPSGLILEVKKLMVSLGSLAIAAFCAILVVRRYASVEPVFYQLEEIEEQENPDGLSVPPPIPIIP